MKFSVLRSSLGLHRYIYYPSLPRKSYWHPTSSFLLRTDMGVAPLRHRCAELLFANWNTSLAFNKDYFTVTFRQRWADFHALAPATSSLDSWFPHTRALFASFGLSSYFDQCRQIEYGRLCLALIKNGTSYELAQCRQRSTHPSASTTSGGLSNTKVTRLSHLSLVIDHLQRKAPHQLTRWMRKSATQSYSTRVPFLSTTVVCHYTFSCGAVLRRNPASSGASSRFGRATCLGSVAIANITTQRYTAFSSFAPQTS
jgi:hypothetical protein